MLHTVSLKSDLSYIGNLTKASVQGLTSALKKSDKRKLAPRLTLSMWAPAAVGAAIGLLSARYSKRNTSGFGVALRGVVGSAIGLGAGVGFTTRQFAFAAVQDALENVNTVRDARWLERNPIDYA